MIGYPIKISSYHDVGLTVLQNIKKKEWVTSPINSYAVILAHAKETPTQRKTCYLLCEPLKTDHKGINNLSD